MTEQERLKAEFKALTEKMEELFATFEHPACFLVMYGVEESEDGTKLRLRYNVAGMGNENRIACMLYSAAKEEPMFTPIWGKAMRLWNTAEEILPYKLQSTIRKEDYE